MAEHTIQIRHGDCIEVLRSMPSGSIGHMVSDPPYDLVSGSGGFMGKAWDATGIAFSSDLWDEVYRTLRPGGVVKAFCGTRTYHRMTAAMRKAGFVNFSIDAWTYGSGFPKSLNIGKKLLQSVGEGGVTAEEAQLWDGWGTALKPAWEPVVICYKPL